MFFKPNILCRHERVDHIRRHGIIIGIDTVAGSVIITAHFGLAVGSIYERRQLIVRVLKLFDRRHITDNSVIYQEQEKHYNEPKAEK